MQDTTNSVGIDTFVREIDVLIRARYPLVGISTFEEFRFRRLMVAVSRLDRHKAKGLFWWSRTQGLRQIAGSAVVVPAHRLVDFRPRTGGAAWQFRY